MDTTINKIISRYIKQVKENFPDFERAFVFGSYVKGNFTQNSDIDIALIFKNMEDIQRFDLQVLLMLLASKIDTRIEPHPLSHEDFYQETPFAHEIKRNGFEILEKTT